MKLVGGLVILFTLIIIISAWNKPVKAQVVEYVMQGRLSPTSYRETDGKTWADYRLGVEYMISTATPIIMSHMRDMEGRTIKVTIEVINDPPSLKRK